MGHITAIPNEPKMYDLRLNIKQCLTNVGWSNRHPLLEYKPFSLFSQL